MVEEYLLSHHKLDILKILQNSDATKHHSVNINFVELFEYDTNVGNNILKNPEETLDELDDLVNCVQNKIKGSEEATDCTLKSVHARIYGLPAYPELHRNIFPKNEDLNLFLQVTGTVIRITATKILEYQRPYICAKCKYVTIEKATYEQKYRIIPPKTCSNTEGCPGTNLKATGELQAGNCKDYQEIKIQEQTSKIGVGTMPNFMWVTLEDDLVDTCKPGDDVTICGIVKRRWGPCVPGKRIDVELVLKANHIQVNNSQLSPGIITHEIRERFVSFWENHKARPLEGRDLILKSFCPKLYGMYTVKLAVALVLAGGSYCTKGNEIGIQLRSEPHLLLVGDPGTGKSQLLRYSAKVIPRSVLTTGIGSTTAGLTVAAIMEDGQWQLEGGALVLADGGVCCIDEFNSMKSHDRTSIHEAMEQQTISVAKASIVCKLKTRCSILAATNPKGGYLDSTQPLSLNLALPSPLLSRFDLVLMLKDHYSEEWDNMIADYILSGKGINAIKVDASLWNLEMLQQYFMIIKTLNPILTPLANKILSSYYQAQRRADLRNKARTTVRLLDSLIRLSQAHAKLMFHTEVHVMDALFAIMLIESSMNGECAIFTSDKVNVQASFPEFPMESYVQSGALILNALGLQAILQEEMNLLKSGYNYEADETSSEKIVENKTLNVFNSSVNSRTGDEEVKNVLSKENEFSAVSTINNLKSPNVIESTKNNSTDNGQELCENLINVGNNEVRSDADDHNSPRESKKKISFSQYKFSKIEKPKLKHIQTEFKNNDNLDKKRKKSIPDNYFCKRKPKRSDTNELHNMINLIPSVNDDFDINILNFETDNSEHEINADKTEESICSEEYAKSDDKTVSLNDNTNEENIDSKYNINKIEDLKELESKNSLDCEIKPSQNTKIKNICKQFRFKPRNIVPSVIQSESEIHKNTQVSPPKSINDINESLITPSSQNVFEGQDDDYDSLNFDF